MRHRLLSLVLVAGVMTIACPSRDPHGVAPDASPPDRDAATVEPAPEATPSAPLPAPPPPPPPRLTCPRGMVKVEPDPKGSPQAPYCIDQWEASLKDKATGMTLSAYYPPDRKLAVQLAETWDKQRAEMGSDEAQQIPLPPLPAFQREREVDPVAMSKPGVVPNGYLSGLIAKRACVNAGKRLCTKDEWQTACKGVQKRQFPYGDKYVQGACNIFRAMHPAKELHDNASIGHLDPRLNLVKDGSDPLLRPTGGTPRCKSEWPDGAAHDMNGNLDEWVEDDHGLFMGGFYSRSKKDGCESQVSAHVNAYFDYSTGTRCCVEPTAK